MDLRVTLSIYLWHIEPEFSSAQRLTCEYRVFIELLVDLFSSMFNFYVWSIRGLCTLETVLLLCFRELRPREDGWLSSGSVGLVLQIEVSLLYLSPGGNDRLFNSQRPGQMPMIKFHMWPRARENGPIQDNILNHEADISSLWPDILCSFSGSSFLICELKTYDAHSYYKIFSSHVICPGFS